MKIEKQQSIMEGEIKVLKDTVWRLTTRVFGLEEEIKQMKIKLKLTTAVDSRLVYSQQILSRPPATMSTGRSSRTSTKSVTAPITPTTSTRNSSRFKEKERKLAKTVKFETKRSPSSSKAGPKSKTRQIAVKKTTNVGTGKTPRRLEHQSVITQRGRRATSFKLQPQLTTDEEKEVYFVSDSSDDEKKTDNTAVSPEKYKTKSSSKNSDSAADDFMKVLNEAPSSDYSTIEAHEDLIVFPTNELNIGSDVGIHISHEEIEQLPLKKRKLETVESDDNQTAFRNDVYIQDREEQDEIPESVIEETVVSYIHRAPESFNCFFCGQQFLTDEERAVHSRIHAGGGQKKS